MPQSFTPINNMLWNYYEAVYKAKAAIESGVASLSGAFAPMASPDMSDRIIIDIVLMDYLTLAAPLWNGITKSFESF